MDEAGGHTGAVWGQEGQGKFKFEATCCPCFIPCPGFPRPQTAHTQPTRHPSHNQRDWERSTQGVCVPVGVLLLSAFPWGWARSSVGQCVCPFL